MAPETDPFENPPELPRIVAVSLHPTGHLHNFLAGNLALKRGDNVVVECDWGARREQSNRWSGSVRPRAVLLVMASRLRGRHRQDGARAGLGAQSVAAGRNVRAP